MSMALELKSIPNIEKYSIIKGMTEIKPKLLVVDDEPDQCSSIKRYFSRRNFIVFTAESGEDALKSINENKPDLVLLDIKLASNMDGKDVLRLLRDSGNQTKVAMITGDVLDENAMQEIADLGIVDFLHKPVDVLTIESVVKKALRSAYPETMHFEAIKHQEEPVDASLRRIAHDLSNITSDIANKCELYILDTEEGLNEEKSEKERLNESMDILKSVLKQTERLTDIVKKLSLLAKKEL